MSLKLSSSRAVKLFPAVAAGLAAILSPALSFGQAVARVTEPVKDSALVTLKGSVHPLARAEFDRGRVEDSHEGKMILVLKRSPEQDRELRELIEDQQTAGSPNFHKWLTPEQFGQRFGVADSDVERVTDYLRENGFTVGRVYKNKSAIEVSGTAGQLRATFHTEIHSYSIHGEVFFANATDPKIPEALAPVVRGFAALNNIRASKVASENAPKSIPVSYDAEHRRLSPEYTGNVGAGTFYLLAASDIQNIYDLPVSSSDAGKGGTNATVGVIGDSQVNLDLISRYQSLSGSGKTMPTEIVDGVVPGIVPTSANTPDAVIAYEQLELIGAAAPNANINYYVAAGTDYDSGLDFAMIRAVEDNTVQVLTIGFQTCEAQLTASGNQLVESSWLQAAAQGITVVAAAGDSGAGACDVPGSAASTMGVAVNGYASTPYNVAVGGTDFYYNDRGTGAAGTPTSPTQYWNPASSQTSTYGTVDTANLPIPEQPWNGSIQSNDYVSSPTLAVADWAGGGGFSTSGNVAADGSESAYPVPSWQVSAQKNSGVVIPTARSLPDVAFFAGNDYNSALYAICAAPVDCQVSLLTATVTGGTAGAAAVFAGLMADVVAAHGAQGNAGPELYNLSGSLYSSSNKTGVYRDVTAGAIALTHPLSSSVICTGTAAGCTTGTDGSGNKYLYINATYASTAGTGYDEATGLGSIDGRNLVSSWGSPATLTTTTALTISGVASGGSIVHGTPMVISAAVKSSGTPTGNVAFTDTSGLESAGGLEADPLASSTTCPTGFTSPCQVATDAAFTAIAPGDIVNLPSGTTFLPGGTYKVYASYSGDSTNLASVSAPFAITVTPEQSRTFLYNSLYPTSTPTSPTSVIYGTQVSFTSEAFSLNNVNVSAPTGTMGLYNGGSEDPMVILTLSDEGTATFSSYLLGGSQTYTFTFRYSGDPSYLPSSLPAGYKITIMQAPTTTTLAMATNSISANAPADLSAVVSSTATANTGVAPTGSIVFTNAYTSQTVPLTSGFNVSGQAVGIASLPVTAANPITQTFTPNVMGIVTDGTVYSSPNLGIDGYGYTYSANLLGSTLTVGGTTFDIGTANQKNIVVGANTGTTTITIPSAIYSSLNILATGVNGSQTNQIFTINYSDGTKANFTQSVSDWGNPQSYPGETNALRMSYRDSAGGGNQTGPWYVYEYSFTPSTTKTVTGLTIPANSNVAVVAVAGVSTAAQSFTATYSSDANYSSSTTTGTVGGNSTSYPNTSGLSISLNSGSVAADGTLIINATATQTTGTPAGSVQVFGNGVLIGTFTISSGSQTSYTILPVNGYLPLPSGNVAITAVFTPTVKTIQPSTAMTTLTVTDDRTVGDFAISTDTEQQAITSSSTVAYFKVELTAIQNFAGLNDPITVTCAVPGTTGLKCALSVSSVTIGTSGTAMLQARISGVPSTVNSSALHPPVQPDHWWLVGGGSALACVFILGIPARRKGWHGLIAVLVCTVLIAGPIMGCGTSNNLASAITSAGGAGGAGGGAGVHANAASYTGGLAASTVIPGSYQVIFTGTATSNTKMTHNTSVTVNVSIYTGNGSAGLALTDGGSYVFSSFDSGLLLTDYGASNTANNGMTQYPADGTNSQAGLDQQWIFTYQGHSSAPNSGNPGYYTIKNAASGLYLTDPGGSTNSIQLTQAATLTDGSQYWTLNTLEGGFELVNGLSGGVLDDDSFLTTPGTPAIAYPQKPISDSINQIWTITPVTP